MAHLFTHRFSLIICLFASAGIFTLLSSPVLAGRIHETDWQEGVVVLNNHEVLNGEVYYDHQHDLVLLRSEAHQPVKTFTVRQVQSFRYYDNRDNIIHHFLAIDRPTQAYTSYSMRSFYEVVSGGEVLYLRQRNRCPLAPPQGVSSHIVAYDYYAYYQGRLIRSHQFEKLLLPVLVEVNPTLSQYIKESRLKPYDIGDQILLAEYFNQQSVAPMAGLSSGL